MWIDFVMSKQVMKEAGFKLENMAKMIQIYCIFIDLMSHYEISDLHPFAVCTLGPSWNCMTKKRQKYEDWDDWLERDCIEIDSVE